MLNITEKNDIINNNVICLGVIIMKKSMDYFKFAVFCLLCASIFALLANMIKVKPILILSSISIVLAVMATIGWVCSLMYNKFKYSKNVIVILMFGCLAFAIYLVNPQSFMITTFSGFRQLDFTSTLFIVSSFISCSALIVLIARMMFPKKQ